LTGINILISVKLLTQKFGNYYVSPYAHHLFDKKYWGKKQ